SVLRPSGWRSCKSLVDCLPRATRPVETPMLASRKQHVPGAARSLAYLLFAVAALVPPTLAQTGTRSARSLYAEERQRTREAFERKDDKALRDALLQL